MMQMGLLTTQTIVVQTRPAPQPRQIQIGFALGEGARKLSIVGVILNVGIGIDTWTAQALQAQNRPVPKLYNCQALVDTGASGLALDKSVVQSLNLVRRGVVSTYTAGGRTVSNSYFVSLTFPGTQLRSYGLLRATEVDLADQPFKCLIGGETMANWHFHYNGQSGSVSIAD